MLTIAPFGTSLKILTVHGPEPSGGALMVMDWIFTVSLVSHRRVSAD